MKIGCLSDDGGSLFIIILSSNSLLFHLWSLLVFFLFGTYSMISCIVVAFLLLLFWFFTMVLFSYSIVVKLCDNILVLFVVETEDDHGDVEQNLPRIKIHKYLLDSLPKLHRRTCQKAYRAKDCTILPTTIYNSYPYPSTLKLFGPAPILWHLQYKPQYNHFCPPY